jgi:hypothetical protein
MILKKDVEERAALVREQFSGEFEQLRCLDNGEPLALVIAELQLRLEALVGLRSPDDVDTEALAGSRMREW